MSAGEQAEVADLESLSQRRETSSLFVFRP
jgi:hypothetical protein